MSGYSQLSK